jgi:hypothetical protein
MKQREPRHNVVVPARIRAAQGWADATILNLSNRGLMFRSTLRHERGGYLELRRGSHVIVARVMWSDGLRHGARAQGIIPVADIILDKPVLSRAEGKVERRALPRPAARAENSRQHGRQIEFVITGIAVACATLLAANLTFAAFKAPLAEVATALASR